MKPTPHNQRLLGLLINQDRQLNNIYNNIAVRLSYALKRHKVNPRAINVWSGGNTAIEKEIDKIFSAFGSTMLYMMKGNIGTAWELAEKGNDGVVKNYIKDIADLAETEKAKLFYRNATALEAFQERKTAGMNLSDRVWKIAGDTKVQLEQVLSSGVLEGKAAAGMTTDLRKFLKEPDKLFRRVKAADGTLKLSKSAMDYHPGRGVYRSSYQNALRLARTETNMAYKTADNARRENLPFVIGFTVHLSNSHPAYDICDDLVGDYPKNFQFIGWHPNCLCFTTAKLLSKQEFIKHLNGEKISPGRYISDIPSNAQKFISDNSSRFDSYKNPPYFLSNFKKVDGEYKWESKINL